MISPVELNKIVSQHLQWLKSKGKQGEQANLEGRELRYANLEGVDLRKANLSSANFSHAFLTNAKLREADLSSTNLSNSNLLDAEFQEANLQNADLTEVKNLSWEQLAGANLRGARMPEGWTDSVGLAHVSESCKGAQRLLIWTLIGCAYIWLTVGTTTDAALITDSASYSLPLVNAELPVVSFYIVAPIVLLCIFLYFQLYLQRLCERVALLPAIFPDGSTLDKRINPWPILGSTVLYFRQLRSTRPPLSFLQFGLSFFLVRCVVPVTFILLWTRYLTLQRYLF